MSSSTAAKTKNIPWWIPTVYLGEGLPYFAVNVLAVALYTNLGVGVKEMTFWTSLLSLPWVIKPFWAPIVDIIATKRKWVLSMQLVMAALMALITFLIPMPFYFSATLGAFFVLAFLSATHDIAADGYYMLALTHHQQAAYSGLRNTFYRIAAVAAQGGLIALAGHFHDNAGLSYTRSWSYIFALLAAVYTCIYIADRYLMPKPESDRQNHEKSIGDILRDFGDTFVTFFTKRHIVVALLFMLFYRLPEALLSKILFPFFHASRADGGLALSDQQIGLGYGFIGVIALLAGGILGGICVSMGGLKKWLWWMALSLTIPSGFYCYLAMAQPDNIWLINAGIGIEQFGYGFGFTAYMLYLIYFCEGKYKTSHYAFCTGIMALGMMLPGMASGWLLEHLSSYRFFFDTTGPTGYVNFFWFMMATAVLTFAVCYLVKIPADFGKKTTGKK